jgi:hypothetical protein
LVRGVRLIKLHGVQAPWRARLEDARSAELSEIATLRYLEAGATLVCALLAQVRDTQPRGEWVGSRYRVGGVA